MTYSANASDCCVVAFANDVHTLAGTAEEGKLVCVPERKWAFGPHLGFLPNMKQLPLPFPTHPRIRAQLSAATPSNNILQMCVREHTCQHPLAVRAIRTTQINTTKRGTNFLWGCGACQRRHTLPGMALVVDAVPGSHGSQPIEGAEAIYQIKITPLHIYNMVLPTSKTGTADYTQRL